MTKIMNMIIRLITLLVCINWVAQSQTLDLNSLRLAQKQISKSAGTVSGVTKKNKNQDTFIIDKPVDPKKYFVGPGDQFHINIISSNETFDHSLVISPTGKLLIPSVGIVECNRLTLSELIKEIKKQIRSWNKNIKINVELEVIRQFRVLVTGQFNNAGYFVVTPMTRISDLFEQIISDYNQRKKESISGSNGESIYNETFGMRSRIAVDDFYKRKLGIDQNLQKNDINLLSKRNITVIRGNDSIKVDLEKFKVTGNELCNPYIHQNDIIHIPYKNRYFTVKGGIQKPGEYEYKVNDNINDALLIAGGLHHNAKVDNLRITRVDSTLDSKSFYLKMEQSKNSELFPEDHIMVPYFDNENPHNVVEIIGEVKYPGSYPIIAGETTINDIIYEAGGFLPNADSSKIFINNSTIAKIPDRELERILLKDELNRSIEEKAYVKARIRTEKGALETSSADVQDKNHLLSGDDIIFVPRYFPYVEVIGSILSPGRYPFVIGNKANDYIDMAGGISKNASRKRFIVKSTTGQRLKLRRNQNIDSGDIIFIPERLEYNEWYAAKELIAAVGQVVVLFVYIQTIIIRS